MGFRRQLFFDCIERTIDNRGRTPPFSEDGIPLVEVKHIKHNHLYPKLDSKRFVSPETYDTWFRGHVKPGDVLFSTVGSIGRVCRVPRSSHIAIAQNVLGFRADQEIIEARFLYYAMQEAQFQHEVQGRNIETVLASIKVRDLKTCTVSLPPLPEQRRIAAILGALDDKIECNSKMNQTLEATAQAIFRSWFVDFDGVPPEDLVDSELGPIPKGWKISRLRDHISLDKGLSYKGKFLTETGTPMVNLKCINRGGGFNREGIKPYSGESKGRHEVVAGDVIIANTDITQARDVLGCPAFVPAIPKAEKIIASHHTFIVRFNNEASVGRNFLYHLLLSPMSRRRCRGFATGTTVLAVPKDAILDFSFALPNRVREFETFVSSLRNRIEINENEVVTLTALRDTLLPKLISGEVRVPEAEAQVEAVG